MTYRIWGEGEPEKVLFGFELGYVGCHWGGFNNMRRVAE